MKYSIVITLILGLSVSLSAQKSKVLAVTQMIDAEKYDEAKEAIELALLNNKTSNWPRTYYTKGLLCQTAYEAGVKSSDTKKTNLYQDQLFVAYNSYEKALELDGKERFHASIRQNYILLDNDFRSMGEQLFRQREYKGALRAFEYAIRIGESDLISAKSDTSLVLNAAMAAYEGQEWEKAILYLTGLHDNAYSLSASLLLAMSYVESGDTLQSEEVLLKGLEMYHYEDSIVMYLVNQMVSTDRLEPAIGILDSAIAVRPDNFRFYWARGLVYRRMNENEEAIESFFMAAERSPESPILYYHIGVCYYNIGIDLRESALLITENKKYLEAREKYLEKYREALKWFERSYALNPYDEEIVFTLYQLYGQLQMKEEQESLKHLIN